MLNGSNRKVAESYRERVDKTAERLGYTPNLSAQATARGSAAIVALLVADIADPYYGQLATGVARGAEEAGLVVTIAITERDPQRELRLVRALRGQRPRELVLAASRTEGHEAAGHDDELAAFTLMDGHVAVVGTGGGDARTVALDNQSGALALGLRLAELGYREAVVIAAAVGIHTPDDRVTGFREGFASGGGVVREVRRTGFSRDAGYESTQQLLADDLRAGTLIFGISDVVAFGITSAIRDAGRHVGADIAVAGFDDIAIGRDIRPGLTTVHVPLEERGHRALHAATDEQQWNNNVKPPLPLEVVVRGSTPPRS